MPKKYIHKVTKEVAVPCPDWRYILNSSLLYIPESILTSGNDWEAIEKDNRHPWRYWYPEAQNIEYRFINSNENIKKYSYLDLETSAQGLAFQTKEEAEKELAKRKAIVTIKRYISDTFGVFEPDWDDNHQYKIIPIYDYFSDCWQYVEACLFKNYSPIWYFSCVDHYEEITKKFNKELRIIFDVE